MSSQPGRARGREGGRGSGQGRARPGFELPRHLPDAVGARPAGGFGQRGAPWVGRALGEPSLSLGAGLTRNWEPDEGGSTSVPLLSLASELQAQPVMPPSPATPATQAAAVDIFHSPFEGGVRGAQPMMGTKGSRALFPAQPSERIQSLWENRAKGKEMEVRGNRG